MLGMGGLSLLILVLVLVSCMDAALVRTNPGSSPSSKCVDEGPYNSTYPLTPPSNGAGGTTYRIAMIADVDKKSKVVKDDGSTVWHSYLKKGYLTYSKGQNGIKIEWDAGDPIALESGFSLKGRGMELSELVTFNGRLLTFDDRTGLIYEIVDDKLLPWVILLDGNGRNSKGFKSEWATVKQQKLYVGSTGKEWTTRTGDFINQDPMFVKEVTPSGMVRSLDWSQNYKRLRRKSMQIQWPGYMMHESGVWSELNKRWYFMPRRCSKEKYDDVRDEQMGCNVLISADENLKNFKTIPLEKAASKAQGFSSFKFIPGTDDQIIVAIKSEEIGEKFATFITIFDINGKTLMPVQKIDTEYKYEGIEFI